MELHNLPQFSNQSSSLEQIGLELHLPFSIKKKSKEDPMCVRMCYTSYAEISVLIQYAINIYQMDNYSTCFYDDIILHMVSILTLNHSILLKFIEI